MLNTIVKATLISAALLSCLLIASCSKPDPLTADEVMQETLSTALDLQMVLDASSLRGMGAVIPDGARFVEKVDEKDSYIGTSYWETKIDGMIIGYDVVKMFDTGIATASTLGVSLKATDSELQGINERKNNLPGTSRGLRLGDPQNKILRLYGKPSEMKESETTTSYIYKVADYMLSVSVERNSRRILLIRADYFK
jgi:hypothetical protein